MLRKYSRKFALVIWAHNCKSDDVDSSQTISMWQQIHDINANWRAIILALNGVWDALLIHRNSCLHSRSSVCALPLLYNNQQNNSWEYHRSGFVLSPTVKCRVVIIVTDVAFNHIRDIHVLFSLNCSVSLYPFHSSFFSIHILPIYSHSHFIWFHSAPLSRSPRIQLHRLLMLQHLRLSTSPPSGIFFCYIFLYDFSLSFLCW